MSPGRRIVATAPAFLDGCKDAARALRAGVRRLIAASPEAITRATDLQHALSIRAPLAWQVFRLAKSPDELACIPFAPLPEAMARVFDAARRAGWPTPDIDRARRAYEAFEQFVARHADDRTTFDAMVSGLSGGFSEQVDARTRRAAFRASAPLWGLRAALTYRCLIAALDRPGSPALSAIIQGSGGVRALRPGRSLPICRRTITMTLADKNAPEFTPDTGGTGLLEDFCSANLSRVTTKRRGSVAHDFVELSGVGLTAETDVFLSTKLRTGLPDDEPELGVTSMVRVPTELYIADLLVPAGAMDPESATVRVYGCLEDVSGAETASLEYLLPSSHAPEYLGRSLDSLHSKDFPRGPELIRFVLRDLGRSREDFDIFRCRIPYPMLHTCIGLDVRRRHA
ncbi:MAG: hypothetical protein JNL50_14945 [Phycisphaerae bacterium]|nr:hypothetical protein [Phycisphaerae bacterium]